MPDIDVDFCFERRGEVIEYVRQKYGKESVGQIVTFGINFASESVSAGVKPNVLPTSLMAARDFMVPKVTI